MLTDHRNAAPRGLAFFATCVDWPRERLGALHYLIRHGEEITRKTFLRHVDRDALREIEDGLCYARHPSQGLTMAADWHVAYYRLRAFGVVLYWFQHSRIEHVFCDAGDIDTLEFYSNEED